MSFLDIDTSDAKEPGVVEGGKEYKLTLVSYMTDENANMIRIGKKGQKFFMPVYRIETDEFVKSVSQYIEVPDKDAMDPATYESKKLTLEKWKKCFGAPTGGFDLADLIGNSGFCILKVVHDDEYGDKNEITKMMAGN